MAALATFLLGPETWESILDVVPLLGPTSQCPSGPVLTLLQISLLILLDSATAATSLGKASAWLHPGDGSRTHSRLYQPLFPGPQFRGQVPGRICDHPQRPWEAGSKLRLLRKKQTNQQNQTTKHPGLQFWCHLVSVLFLTLCQISLEFIFLISEKGPILPASKKLL